MTLPLLELPDSLNYIGLFLTLDCNLNCSYCINDPEQAGQRATLFKIQARDTRHLSPEQWITALKRIPYRQDLPVTLQGGEPTLYWKTRGLGPLLGGTEHYFDLLTNFALKPRDFVASLDGNQRKLQRDAPYPSIRVSYHAAEMNRTWQGRGFAELVERCEALGSLGFRVAPRKTDSDVGIYMVAHPDNQVTPEMEALYQGRVPFETKEFLGVHQGQLYGHYLYPYSTDLIARHFAPSTLACECRTTELLIDPLGFVWGCHYYLYANWEKGGPEAQFAKLAAGDFRYRQMQDDLFDPEQMRPIGHLLDPDFTMAALTEFRSCREYGRCIGCDTKIKNDRFQSYYDQGIPHTSVQMRNIQLPSALRHSLAAEELDRVAPYLAPLDGAIL
ncbi:4Fe-4S cluster-binding domain-containing protein [Azospira inquinata]|uniref:4Fe-4S cluster-binding domain-containing protein n=1 Tax=Azospira inquinata TaxID=2785627 RepID=A0A975SMA7_9RHOO|nr:4Fe-4S cluster-binding domain-containing protein [Azospira inquinata]QWT46222.1 4Fe-4S cluster-binding domain-containing protein [Azospira inquinata]QWT48449.1 4Fe-4S cluster-binding domain-containing protein [Azospira inquinata]